MRRCVSASLLLLLLFTVSGCRKGEGLRGWGNDLSPHKTEYIGALSNAPVTKPATITVQTPRKTVICTGTLEPPSQPYTAPDCSDAYGYATLTCRDGRSAKVAWQAATCTSVFVFPFFSDGRSASLSYGFNSVSEADAALGRIAEKIRKEKQATPANAPPQAGTSPAKPPQNAPVPSKTLTLDSLKNSSGNGSGFYVTDNGLVVTNAHVVEDAKRVVVCDYSVENAYEASVLRVDAANDLAVLKIETKSTGLPLAAGAVRKGQDILALGYPMMDIQGIEQKATFGRVNSLTGVENDIRKFQMDVPIQPGNSGGPVLNRNGEVVGVATSTVVTDEIRRNTKILMQNVNYAVKAEYVKAMLATLPQHYKPVPDSRRQKTADMTELVARSERSVVLILVWTNKR